MFSEKSVGLASVGMLAAALFTGCSRQDFQQDLTIKDPIAAKPSNATTEKLPWVDNKGGFTLFYFDSDWPGNLQLFCARNPNLSITDISKVSEGLYSLTQKVMLVTAEKQSPTRTEVLTFKFDESWPASLRDYLKARPDTQVTASFPATEGYHSVVSSMLVVVESPLR